MRGVRLKSDLRVDLHVDLRLSRQRPDALQLLPQPMRMLEAHRMESKLLCSLDIRRVVVDEDGRVRRQPAALNRQFEDARIGFREPDLARDDDIFEPLEKAE